MQTIGIATDSHSGISPRLAQELGVRVLPMPFTIDGQCYYENVTISREDFFARQRKTRRRISTWKNRLTEPEIACTMTL